MLLLLNRFSRIRLWLPRPWDSPGKNTGVGCHFLLQCMKVKSESATTTASRTTTTRNTTTSSCSPRTTTATRT